MTHRLVMHFELPIGEGEDQQLLGIRRIELGDVNDRWFEEGVLWHSREMLREIRQAVRDLEAS